MALMAGITSKREAISCLSRGQRNFAQMTFGLLKGFETVIKKSHESPRKITQIGSLDYWGFEGKRYSSGRDLEADEAKALLKASQVRAKQSKDRAKSLASSKSNPIEAKRGQIPSDLRLLIWAKYEGSCANCGSSSELQFDHIIPVVMGGATSGETSRFCVTHATGLKGHLSAKNVLDSLKNSLKTQTRPLQPSSLLGTSIPLVSTNAPPEREGFSFWIPVNGNLIS